MHARVGLLADAKVDELSELNTTMLLFQIESVKWRKWADRRHRPDAPQENGDPTNRRPSDTARKLLASDFSIFKAHFGFFAYGLSNTVVSVWSVSPGALSGRVPAARRNLGDRYVNKQLVR